MGSNRENLESTHPCLWNQDNLLAGCLECVLKCVSVPHPVEIWRHWNLFEQSSNNSARRLLEASQKVICLQGECWDVIVNKVTLEISIREISLSICCVLYMHCTAYRKVWKVGLVYKKAYNSTSRPNILMKFGDSVLNWTWNEPCNFYLKQTLNDENIRKIRRGVKFIGAPCIYIISIIKYIGSLNNCLSSRII